MSVNAINKDNIELLETIRVIAKVKFKIKVWYHTLSDEAKMKNLCGQYTIGDRAIWLNPTMTRQTILSAFFHELAHFWQHLEYLHKGNCASKKLPLNIIELQADLRGLKLAKRYLYLFENEFYLNIGFIYRFFYVSRNDGLDGCHAVYLPPEDIFY